MTLYTSAPMFTSTCQFVPMPERGRWLTVNKPRKFSVDKMRRHMARNTPDAVWRDFSKEELINGQLQPYESWRDHWMKMMRYKHKKEKTISVFQSEQFDKPGFIRIQLVAETGKRWNNA